MYSMLGSVNFLDLNSTVMHELNRLIDYNPVNTSRCTSRILGR